MHLLLLTGLVGSLSGLAVGGIGVGAGVAVAATVWLLAVPLRRRARGQSASCPPERPERHLESRVDRVPWS